MRANQASILFALMVLASDLGVADDQQELADARNALRKAVHFFRTEVSASGGYLWRYSADLTIGEGEGRARRTTVWVQPPGTPSIGDSYLTAYAATGEQYYLDSAREVGEALARGQLQSGGWDYRIEYASSDRFKYRYRLEDDRPKARNTTTLDDNTTQSALRFLMRLDRELEQQDPQIHTTVVYALAKLREAQYPNGAWPQRFNAPPDPEKHPVVPAIYPEKFSRVHPQQDYRSYYTFNDNTLADMIATMFDAADIYQSDDCRESAIRGAKFILLAQMPEPQPAWAQQYNARMEPAWARRFEPASITGGESQGVMRTLLEVYRRTGDEAFLKPIPRALEYLQKSRFPDGRLARFYEFKTNRPLYFTKEYVLTYDDNDLPTHYAFKVGSRLESIERDYLRLRESGPQTPDTASRTPRLTNSLRQRAAAVIAEQDERGAWLEEGTLRTAPDGSQIKYIIDCRTFIRNVETLSTRIEAGS